MTQWERGVRARALAERFRDWHNGANALGPHLSNPSMMRLHGNYPTDVIPPRSTYYDSGGAGSGGAPFFALLFNPAVAPGSPAPDDLRGGCRAPRRFVDWPTFFDCGDALVRHNERIDTALSRESYVVQDPDWRPFRPTRSSADAGRGFEMADLFTFAGAV